MTYKQYLKHRLKHIEFMIKDLGRQDTFTVRETERRRVQMALLMTEQRLTEDQLKSTGCIRCGKDRPLPNSDLCDRCEKEVHNH